TVSFGKDTKGKQRLVITDLDKQEHEYLIAKDKHLLVHDGQVVNKGEMIVDGPVDPHDLLRLLGVEELARYIIDEVQDVYRLQGAGRRAGAGGASRECRGTAGRGDGRRLLRAVAAAVLAAAFSTAGRAELLPKWELGLGATAFSLPDYRGSDERRGYLYPFPF